MTGRRVDPPQSTGAADRPKTPPRHVKKPAAKGVAHMAIRQPIDLHVAVHVVVVHHNWWPGLKTKLAGGGERRRHPVDDLRTGCP